MAAWLSNAGLGEDATSIVFNLQSHKDIGHGMNLNARIALNLTHDLDFPAQELLQQLWNLTQVHTETLAGELAKRTFYVPVTEIAASLDSHTRAFQPRKESLGQALNRSIRRSPKRRDVSEDTERLDFLRNYL